jgi:Flp pilus assembly protein TadG
VRNISRDGLYLCSKESWYMGSLVTLALECTAGPNVGQPVLRARVVRQDKDGVAMEFIWVRMEERKNWNGLLPRITNAASKRRPAWQDAGAPAGAALVEVALVLPLLLLLLLNGVNFGMYMYGWVTVANAARAGAEYATYDGAAVTAPGQPSSSQVQGLVTSDTTSLPNSGSISTTICHQTGTNSPTCSISGLITASDASSFALTAVTVSYTYQPFLSAFNIPSAGVYLTLPPSTIQQQIVMRNIQ